MWTLPQCSFKEKSNPFVLQNHCCSLEAWLVKVFLTKGANIVFVADVNSSAVRRPGYSLPYKGQSIYCKTDLLHDYQHLKDTKRKKMLCWISSINVQGVLWRPAASITFICIHLFHCYSNILVIDEHVVLQKHGMENVLEPGFCDNDWPQVTGARGGAQGDLGDRVNVFCAGAGTNIGQTLGKSGSSLWDRGPLI